jgi:isopenicillin N synthase-like dioxygenase
MPNALPVIDLAPFMSAPPSSAGDRLVTQLREACHGPGFCYLVGHGVPPELDAAVMSVAREFFALPEAEKRSLAIASSPHFRGYTVLGGEVTKGVNDWREQLDVGAEERAAVVKRGDPAWLRLRGPNQWPPRLPAMQPAVLTWMRGYFDDTVLPRGDPHLKIIRYPAQPREANADQGVGMHHDSGLVSFVLQDEVGGLQVELDGTLVDATPKPGTYVMNLGEMLQAATNGYLRATKHRVQSPPSGRERLSVAYFFHPKFECVFAPIALPPELAAQARGGQNVDPNDPIFATFGDNYLKIRLRSHADVAFAHYSDLKPA